MLKKIWDWLVISSANPENTSLTVKAGLTTLVGWLVLVGPLVHLKVGNVDTTAVVDGLSQFVFYAMTAVSAVISGYGLIRKIKNSLS